MSGHEVHVNQHHHGCDKTTHHRDGTKEGCPPTAKPAELIGGQARETTARFKIFGTLTTNAFKHQQDRHEGQQHAGQLGGSDFVAHAGPSPKDPCCECLNPKMEHGPKIGQRLH